MLAFSASFTPSIFSLYGTGNVGIGGTNSNGTIDKVSAADYSVLFGNIASTTGYPGGPLGTNSMAITNGSLNIWNNSLSGWGGSAAAFCLRANASFPGDCQVMGGFTNPWGAATYTLRDQVGALIQIESTPNLFGGSMSGTFDAGKFYPSTPLTPTQIGKLRVGMVIDTNDATPYSGIVSGWDKSSGTYVAVQGWYLQGTTNAETPSGTAATISPESKIYGLNIVANLTSGSQQTAAAAAEVDCDNYTGACNSATDLPTIWCMDLINLGNATSSQGLIIRGDTGSGFWNEINLTSAAGNTAINIAPKLYNPNNVVPVGISISGYTNHGILIDSKASGGTGLALAVGPNGGGVAIGTTTAPNAKLTILTSTSNSVGGEPTYMGDVRILGNSGGAQSEDQNGGLEFKASNKQRRLRFPLAESGSRQFQYAAPIPGQAGKPDLG